MPKLRLIIMIFVLVLVSSLMMTAGAQDTTDTTGNLLNDPGFEFTGVWKRVATGTGDGDGGTTFNVAPAWDGWFTESPRTDTWQNRIPNGFPRSDAGFGFVRSGNRSQEVARGQATFTAAVYQSVAVPVDTNVTASAWFVMNIAGENAGIANSQARIGIDPNGGNNPFDSDIVWSTWGVNQLASNGFRQLNVSATSTGTAVTLFLYATQTVPTEGNGIYWDDAVVSIGGAGGTAGGAANVVGTPAATPVPTAPPIAPFVSAQGAGSDGSIVHVVRSGDTLDAISVAYGVSRDEIVALNDLASIRFLSIGQEILIRPPQENAQDEDPPDEDTQDDETISTPNSDLGDTAFGNNNNSADDSDDTDTTDEQQSTDDEADATNDDDASDANTIDEDTADEDTVAQQSADDEETTDEDTPDEVEEEDPTVVPTETEIPPTPTDAPPAPVANADTQNNIDPNAQIGLVCVNMFEDVNMNRIQDQDELYLGGGQIELNLNGESVEALATDDTPEPLCFNDLEAGEYVAVAVAPTGYGLTTSDQLRLRVQAGSTLNVAFGAAQGVEAIEPPPANANDVAQEVVLQDTTDDEDNTDQLLQISGLIVFGLAGLTLIGGLGAMLLLRRR